MSTSDQAPRGNKNPPGQSAKGSKSAQERVNRQAEQLRANLAKRKQQQRKRDGGGGSAGDT